VEELFEWISKAVNTEEEIEEYSAPDQTDDRVELPRVEEDPKIEKPKPKCCST